MQAMARALTTAADPAQVADAVFAALRDELHVDAATFALVGDTRRTCAPCAASATTPTNRSTASSRRCSRRARSSGENVALFAESLEDLQRQRPDIAASVDSDRFRALAVVPLVVSDHTIGAVVVHWYDDREISEPDRSFLFTITGAGAQAVERARLTVDRIRQPGAQPAPPPAQLGPGGGDHARRRGACRHRRWPAGPRRAVRRRARPGRRRARPVLPGQQRAPGPALARDGAHGHEPSGLVLRTRRRGRWSTTHRPHAAATARSDEDLAAEVVPRVVAELDRPVTVVTEPLVGSVGPLGCAVAGLRGQSEPSEPELRFLSTLAGLTAQALERAQVFEHEREALRAAEAGRERLSLLSEVTRLLSSSLEPTTVIRRTMSLVEGRLADSCIVQVPGRGRDWCVSTCASPASTRSPNGAGGRRGARSLRLRRPGRRRLPDGPDAAGTPRARRRHADPQGVSTALAVPLTANGEVIGVMTFIDGPGRLFEADDVSLATEVASRAGVALSNATRFQREHVVAEVLQRAVLPDSLPSVEGLSARRRVPRRRGRHLCRRRLVRRVRAG